MTCKEKNPSGPDPGAEQNHEVLKGRVFDRQDALASETGSAAEEAKEGEVWELRSPDPGAEQNLEVLKGRVFDRQDALASETGSAAEEAKEGEVWELRGRFFVRRLTAAPPPASPRKPTSVVGRALGIALGGATSAIVVGYLKGERWSVAIVDNAIANGAALLQLLWEVAKSLMVGWL